MNLVLQTVHDFQRVLKWCTGVLSPLMHVPEASNREGGAEFGWSHV